MEMTTKATAVQARSRLRIDRNVELCGKADCAAECEQEAYVRQAAVRILLLHHLDKNGACGEAEHGERYRHKGEVIPHRDAENSSEKQLELEQRQRGKEQPNVGKCRRVRTRTRHRHPPG